MADPWTQRRHAAGGTAHTRDGLTIHDHPTIGINLYRGETLISTGFRSVDAAKDYADKQEATHG